MLKKLSLFSFILFGCCTLLFSFNACKNKKAKATKPVIVKPAVIEPPSVADTVKAENKKYIIPKPDTLNKKVYSQFKLTYMDLLKKVFTGIQKNKYGETIALGTIPIRNIIEEYSDTSFRDTVKISIANQLMIKSSGKLLLLSMYRAAFQQGKGPNIIAGGITLLTLFDPVSGKLLDAVDISSDKETYLAKVNSKYAVPLGQKQEAIIVLNTHHNTNQSYINCSLLTVIDNKIEDVFNYFYLAYHDDCEEFNTDENYVFRKASNGLFGNVSIIIKGKTIKNQGINCKGKKRTIIKNYKAHLIWNTKKKVYVDQLKDFTRLYKQSQANF